MSFAFRIVGKRKGLKAERFAKVARRGHLFNTSHGIRPLLTKAFEIKLPNEFSERQLPWLLVMVVRHRHQSFMVAKQNPGNSAQGVADI